MIVFSLLCWGASLLIPRTGQAAPDLVVQKNILASTVGLLTFLREDPRLWWGALVTSWFWLVGAVALSLMPPLVKNVLGGSEDVVTSCLAIFSVSIAIGSGSRPGSRPAASSCCRPDRRRAARPVRDRSRLVDLGAPPVPGLDSYLSISAPPRAALAIDLAGLAIAGGLFIVPTFAAVQAWAGADRARAWWPPSTCSTPRSWRKHGDRGPAADCRNDDVAAVSAARRRQFPGRGRHRPYHAGSASRCALDHLRALFRIEVNGIDNLNKAGPNSSSRSTM
jgi:acyl-[acyl-carrier-protein]-phospholipid O-acyltransferase/long-chain-fatty-acid--[acyl-carrier-protein] ligase